MIKQYLHLKLAQKLSPQQIQLMKLIQLPTQAFEQRLKEEMNENPALESGKEEEDNYEADEFETNEFDDYDDASNMDTDDISIDDYLSNDEIPDYKLQANNYAEEDQRESPLSAAVSFHQDLVAQLNTFVLSDEEREIAEFLVGSIDEMGYIRRSLADIVDDLAFTQAIYTDEKTVERILHLVHELEPAGIGARDLQECLLLQLKHKTPAESIQLAIGILDQQFEAFTKKHYDKLQAKFGVTAEQLKKAIHEIERLNPKPGGSYQGSSKITETILPDFMIRIVDGDLELTLNGRNAPSLHVSKDYQDMMQTYKSAREKSAAQKEAVQFIKQKLDSAKWFIDAIKQRQETLLVTMNAIMQYQHHYFLEGDESKIRPMILKDIADRVGLDISTVSRVANSKYVETPYGTKLIKEFFSEAMKNDQGEEISTLEIKNILQTVIREEDKSKPLPDDQLVEILKEKGYPIARRTIAKYRELLDIPVARLRKKNITQLNKPNSFLVVFSYVFHPLFIPLMGTLIYVAISPLHYSLVQLLFLCLQVSLLTIFIPLAFYFWLKTVGKADSMMLENLAQRKIPLFLSCILLYILAFKSITQAALPELHFFLLGGLLSNLLTFLYLFMNVKASIHQMGIAALTCFVIGLSAHYQVDLTYGIALLLILNGFVASSRLAMQAHSYTELAIGFGIGSIPQLALWWYWL